MNWLTIAIDFVSWFAIGFAVAVMFGAMVQR